jgi:hypothetical protein
MTAAAIEYLLGIYFAVSAVSLTGGAFSADAFKLLAGIVLIILALMHIGPQL